MRVFWIFIFSVSAYVELNSSTIDAFVREGTVPSVVEFYGSNSIRPTQVFVAVSNQFSWIQAHFGRINCVTFQSVCREFGIMRYPSMKLFIESMSMDVADEVSVDEVVNALVERGALSYELLKILPDLTPETVGRFFDGCKCCLVSFYNRSETGFDSYNLLRLAKMFSLEPNVRIGTIDCNRHNQLCRDYQAPEVPSMRIKIRGQWRDYQGEGWWERVGEYINKECGTFRSAGGYLNDIAGTIPAANKIAKDFVQHAEKREQLLSDVKRIKGTETYVKVMERIMKNGYNEAKSIIDKMFNTLKDRKVSAAALDQLKRRYNICAQFFPTPKPLIQDEL